MKSLKLSYIKLKGDEEIKEVFKKLFFIGLLTIMILIISGGIIAGGICFSHNAHADSSPNITDSINTVNLTQDTNIKLKDIPKNYIDSISNSINTGKISLINKQKAIDIANNYCENTIKNATIKTQQNLLTDDNFSMDILDKKILDNNPIFKSTNKLNNIPVWLVSYENLKLPGRNNTTITQRIIVVDAITGNVLYSLSFGR